MDLRCPKCNSTDLKKVSLAYEEGLFRSNARTRIRGILVGSGGPDIVVGSTATNARHQTALSKRLTPPRKWSYLKLVVWFAVISFLALIIYIHDVMASSSVSSSLPVTIYGLVSFSVFAVLAFLTWKHNHYAYPREYAEWDLSFVCERCGSISEQDLSLGGRENQEC